MGVIKALLELDPIIEKRVKIYAVSGGAVIAPYFYMRSNMDLIIKDWKHIINIHKNTNNFIINKFYCKHLYIDVFNLHKIHLIEKKLTKLNISISKISFDTKFPFLNFKNVILNKFNNNLLEKIIQSAYIPGIMGLNIFTCYYDGSLTSNNYYKKINKKNILSIGTCKHSLYHICYNFDWTYLNTFYPSNNDFIDKLYINGYNDTINYFTSY
jgi:hypothetical protein